MVWLFRDKSDYVKPIDWKIVVYIVCGIFLAIGIAFLIWLWIKEFSTYVRYENKRVGISMKYPRAWKVVDSPEPGAIVAFQEPKENSLDLIQENWSITTTSLVAEPLTLDQYADAAQRQMQFVFVGIPSSRTKVVLSGHPGYRLTFSSQAADGLTFVTWVFIYRDVAYNISYLTTTFKYRDPEVQKAIDHVIRSLKVFF